MAKSEPKKENPIAVFDSGMGGISVLRELVKIMPQEDFIFFGDSKNAPYGTKSLEEVRRLTMLHCGELFEEGVKGLVVACNTATSAAVRLLRKTYPQYPVVGIEPAVKPAVMSGNYPTVLVMATPMTIREEKFQKLMNRYCDRANIIPLPCPGLMDFVERGDLEGDDLRRYLEELLFPFREEEIHAAVLGCTHYPFAGKLIQRVLGPKTKLFDGGPGTAREMRRRLKEAGLLKPEGEKGTVLFRNSSKDPEKIRLSHRLFEGVPSNPGSKGGKTKMNLPKDEMMLFSVINTELRDHYASLDELAASYMVEKQDILDRLSAAGFVYDPKQNCFAPR